MIKSSRTRTWEVGCKQVLCRNTRHSCRDKNKFIEYKLCRDIIKIFPNTIQEQAKRTGRDRIQEATIEATTKIKSYVLTKRAIWARIFGIHNAINEVRPNIGKPINTHF